MSNKRITDLTELTTPTTDDVFPVVDIATNTTQKVQLANLPVQTAVTTALATKQDTLVSGTNIKTVNSTSLVGSGNVAVQPTLVSGTNIKTLNSVSLLGSGDIVLAATPSGVSGAIQFSNGSAFASDATNFFWNDTTKRLGVGTNNPQDRCEVNGNIRIGASAFVYSSAGGGAVTSGLYLDSSTIKVSVYTGSTERVIFGNSTVATIKGSGSTSATTSLLVQNSAGTATLSTRDDGVIVIKEQITNSTTVPFLILNNSNGFYGGYNQGTGGAFGAGGSGGNLIVGSTNILTFSSGGVSINKGSNPDASAALDLVGTTKGFLMPRMTTTQINAIASPANGLEVYNTTLACPCFYDGTAWRKVSHTTM